MWFHGSMGRERSEDVLIGELQGNPAIEGAFLVRQSSSREQKYVLSCLFNNKTYHFPINQHDNENGSLSLTSSKSFRGLDELIKYYQENHDESLGVNLSSFSFAKGESPPIEYCQRGRKTSLHSAIDDHEDFEDIRKLLRQDSEPLDGRDENGKTALHLACQNADIDLRIPEAFIENGASITIRDWTGYTPFLYACENGLQEIVELMISKNKDVIQMRNCESLDVPLHVACRFGRLEIVKILLKNNAALRPQNNAGQFPIDVAADARQEKVVMFLNNYRTKSRACCRLWDHGSLSREDAEKILTERRDKILESSPDEIVSGLFLVRFSRKVKHHVITMLEKEKVVNFEIMKTGEFFHLDQGAFMESLEDLITHYMEFADGLPSKLKIPVKPEKKFLEVPSINRSESNTSIQSLDYYENPAVIMRQTKKTSADEFFVQTDQDYDYYLRLRGVTPLAISMNFDMQDGLFIDSKNLTISPVKLGEGCFGVVNKAILILPGKHFTVAVKTLHSDSKTDSSKDTDHIVCSFLREAAISMNFDHPFIVKMIGIVKGPPMRIVQELQPLGSLLDYLVANADAITASDIIIWATQIAAGMEYLESKRFVHRDLAARNILLASKTHAKISDFGLSRTISIEQKTFNTAVSGMVPIKWYAPECFEGKFSHASDVWSFGVTLWETYSKGSDPYGEMSGEDIKEFVKRGGRLEQPQLCCDGVYRIIQDCWSHSASLRPSFEKLSKIFSCISKKALVS